MTYREVLDTWLRAAGEIQDPIPGAFDLTLLTPNQLTTLAVDLEGIADASAELSLVLRRLVDNEPSADHLETELVEVETNLNHAQWHWASLTQVLRDHGLWSNEEPA